MAQGTGKRIGVVLAGCGYLDGSEIHEATVTLLELDRLGATVRAAAPDVPQMHVVDHLAGKPTAEKRGVLLEASRLVRGKIEPLSNLKASDLDAVVFPGGFGVAKNLCTFAVDGPKFKVEPQVERLVKEMHAAHKPMGFICIAPVIAAKVLGDQHPRLTIGDDRETAAVLEGLGAKHVVCKVDEIAVDERLKVVSTPAYMLGPTIAPVAAGIAKLVAKLIELA
ncbi:MAG TPA: isoprenoid biosynthesis glyoxalase ElbB [Myxococcales bacterium]